MPSSPSATHVRLPLLAGASGGCWGQRGEGDAGHCEGRCRQERYSAVPLSAPLSCQRQPPGLRATGQTAGCTVHGCALHSALPSGPHAAPGWLPEAGGLPGGTRCRPQRRRQGGGRGWATAAARRRSAPGGRRCRWRQGRGGVRWAACSGALCRHMGWEGARQTAAIQAPTVPPHQACIPTPADPLTAALGPAWECAWRGCARGGHAAAVAAAPPPPPHPSPPSPLHRAQQRA